jgi:hypothetical protein
MRALECLQSYWIDYDQDRDYFTTFVNVALNLRVPYAMALINFPKRKLKIQGGITC